MAGRAITCWVHSNEVAYSWHESMMGLYQHAVLNDDTAARGGTYAVRCGTGGLIDARNRAVAAFLGSDEEWLFWIDTDMGFEPDTLDRLIAAADPLLRPVVGALCFANNETGKDGFGGYVTMPKPTVYRWARLPNGETGFVPDHNYARDALVQCDATGSACIVIHRSVLELMGAKYDGNWYGLLADEKGRPFSEDMSFCVRLVEMGVPLFVHTGIRTTHLKPVWLSERHFDVLMMADERRT